MQTGTAADVGASTPGPTRARLRWLLAGTAGFAVLADQLTKAWALHALDDRMVEVVGTLRLRLTFNEGLAFGLGAGRTTVISLVALAVAVVVAVAGLRARSAPWVVGFGLVLGGALGNLVDRAFRDGEGFLGGRVVDFVDLQWWPVFNVADVAIVLGVVGLLVLSLREGEA